MHFGIISPPVPGHLHPFGALGRELIGRGHRVSLIHMPDLKDSAVREGLEFIPIGHDSHPPGSLALSLGELGKLQGLRASRFTIRAVAKTTEMMLAEAPRAIRQADISLLLVDQMEPAGGTIAELLKVPFVTVANALALNREPSIPPAFAPWRYSGGWAAHARNRLGYLLAGQFTRPISKAVDRFRREHGLKPHARADDSFSELAQISQMPSAFDYPRRRLPRNFHYVGPLRGSGLQAVPFPWERLDDRPLIYASLGTLQNSRLPLFRCFAEACEGLGMQLAISHGGGLTRSECRTLPSWPLVVEYAPQRELLSRACLTLTHAGLNTVLDSLSCGVPVVAVPITYEQPAIAERLRHTGAGLPVKLRGLTPKRLRTAVDTVLSDGTYKNNAERMAQSIRQAGGVRKAADIILAIFPGANSPTVP